MSRPSASPAPRIPVFLLLPAALLSLPLLPGCGADGAGGPDVTVRDSAGVAVVENPAPGSPPVPEWRLSEEPRVSIGVLEGAPEYQLYDARSAVRLSDGRIVVANGGTHELRYYDAGGRHLVSVGGEGGGPGEFEGILGIWRIRGDTVVAYDFRQRRLSFFGPDGDHARQTTLERTGERFFPRVAGVFSDGSAVVRVNAALAVDRDHGPFREPVLYVRYDPDGTVADTLGTFPGDASYLSRGGGTGGSWTVSSTVPFGVRTLSAVGPDRIWIGTSDAYEVRAFEPGGALLRIVRRAHEPVPVTPEMIETVKEERLANFEDENWRRRFRRVYEAMTFPEELPAYRAIRVDGAGRLWVRESGEPGVEGERWTVFDRRGRLHATAVFPEEVGILDLGDGEVLVRREDELGVERVGLHPLETGREAT